MARQQLEYVQRAWQCEQENPSTTQSLGRPEGQPWEAIEIIYARSHDGAARTATQQNGDQETTQ